ncbi:MAG: hypothetical protein K2K25_02930 [Muribaculaceae bacterium]|nr:hypothetical protein [Muribaculaceae bacterium]
MWLEPYEDTICQGAIVDYPDWEFGDVKIPLAVVLSNECDLTNDKCGYLILMGLLEADFVLKSSKEYQAILPENFTGNFANLTKKQKEAITKYFEGFIHNKDIRRYFFLGGDALGLPNLVVDFQLLKSIPYANIPELKPIGKVKSPFKEQMIVHFASYTSRIPTERVSEDIKLGLLNSLISSDAEI